MNACSYDRQRTNPLCFFVFLEEWKAVSRAGDYEFENGGVLFLSEHFAIGVECTAMRSRSSDVDVLLWAHESTGVAEMGLVYAFHFL